MPELPEVETVRRGLAPVMEGARVERLELRRPDLRFPFPEAFAERVAGRTVIALGRRAKYLLIDLEDGATIIAHLGMSGSFRIEAAETTVPGSFHHERSKDEKHDHAIFHLRGPQGASRVVYNDPRRFGFMLLAARKDLDEHPALKDLGPEPVGNLLSAEMLATRFAGKAQNLKQALLDQRIIAGLGNIYVCEALWRAGLSPDRSAATIVTTSGKPSKSLEDLTQAIRDVIAEAIEAGGSSLRDHIQADGTLGYFQHTFRVYDREGEPCPKCATLVSRKIHGGRSSFFCGRCQT